MQYKYNRYKLNRLVSVRQLCTVHYFTNLTKYETDPHSHCFWEMVYCSRGVVNAWDDTRKVVLGPGEIIFHQPDLTHHITVGDEPSTLFVLSFVCSNECMKLFRHKRIHLSSEQRSIMSMIIRELRSAFELNNGKLQLSEFNPSPTAPVGAEQMVYGYLEWLLISLLRSSEDSGESVSSEQLEEALEMRIMNEIQEYVRTHLSERITIQELAKHVHYSRAYITVQFKAATGMSIMDYVEKQRMARAKELLARHELTVTQIAEGLGYASLQYFSRRFRIEEGCSPSEYLHSLPRAEDIRSDDINL